MRLTPEQIECFAREGYVLVPRVFAGAALDELKRWTGEVEAAPETRGRHMVYKEPSLLDRAPIIQRIENFCPFHVEFNRVLTDDGLIEMVGALFGEPAVLFKDKINFKLLGGDGFKLHQDQQAGWSKYAPLFITALVAVDDASEENGCLYVARGPRAEGLLGPEWRPLEPAELEGRALEAVPTAPGDVLFFDSYLPHASEPNLASASRRILYVTYNRASDGDHRSRYFAEKRVDFPPDIEREPGKTYVFRV
jgi:ectoine hydroxylase-related dioxygenase (phytanoyl-CoA dioxygenase family)